MKTIAQTIILAASLVLGGCATNYDLPESYTPPTGFVPDAKTAAAIAEAVWVPIYGAKKIQQEKPFSVTLRDNVWTVRGYLEPNVMGGTAIAEISRKDGRILRVIHEK